MSTQWGLNGSSPWLGTAASPLAWALASCIDMRRGRESFLPAGGLLQAAPDFHGHLPSTSCIYCQLAVLSSRSLFQEINLRDLLKTGD